MRRCDVICYDRTAILFYIASATLHCVIPRVFGFVFADQLLTLRDDTWWEVKAQLLIVCMTVLDLLDPVVRDCPLRSTH